MYRIIEKSIGDRTWYEVQSRFGTVRPLQLKIRKPGQQSEFGNSVNLCGKDGDHEPS